MNEYGDRGKTELPGEPWPGDINADVEKLSQHGPRTWMLMVLLLMLVAFTIYGMATSDQGVLDDVFDLVRSGLFMALGWTFGRQASG